MKALLRRLARYHYAQAVAVRWIYAATRAGSRPGLVHQMVARHHARRLVRRFGIYVSPTATIGPGLILPHPVGIVIGEGCVIGANATLYQHVTLGRKSRHDPRYPVIGDDVVLYPGAVVIGPVRIGAQSRIGANQVVACDLPDGAVLIPPAIEPIIRPEQPQRGKQQP
ncbi:serine acetyltransferase [Sphingobium yanoikuyae]|uniref:serine O-acetyltransferase n=1 Tax=Sphingobium yanoikuyae TaxID=13690 RepID=UPI0028AF95A7|nr:serine acetyltransferase [Sphingobium yanoikuyae]